MPSTGLGLGLQSW